jgi:hypothetical protein
MYNWLVDMTNQLDKPNFNIGPGQPQSTVLETNAIRQAKEQKEEEFEALAAYANLGDTPDSWQRFRLGWPHFFCDSPSEIDRAAYGRLAEWLYASAEDWVRFCSEQSASLPADYRLRVIPPLLWYRDLLRVIWKRNDPRGAALCALLGFEDQARRAGLAEVVPAAVRRPLFIPGQSALHDQLNTNGLPPGQPIVDESTYTIRWEFGCQFQRAVYRLMQELWLAKVCPQCGKYFIGVKPARKFCSTRCSGEKRASGSLDYYHREGKYRREKQKHLQEGSKGDK